MSADRNHITNDAIAANSQFHWNAGGWWGSVAGCSLWMLILGLALTVQDVYASVITLGGFIALFGTGIWLWRCRESVSAYYGIQWFLLATMIVYALVVTTVYYRGRLLGTISESLVLPLQAIVLPPGLMLMFFLQEKFRSRGGRQSGQPAKDR